MKNRARGNRVTKRRSLNSCMLCTKPTFSPRVALESSSLTDQNKQILLWEAQMLESILIFLKHSTILRDERSWGQQKCNDLHWIVILGSANIHYYIQGNPAFWFLGCFVTDAEYEWKRHFWPEDGAKVKFFCFVSFSARHSHLYLCCNITGKTITFARNVDIPRSAHNFRFFASSVLHHTTDCSQMNHMDCLNYTIRCPVGVGERLMCLH